MTSLALPGIAVNVIRAVLLLCALAAASAHAAEPKRILMLHSYGRDTSPYDSISSVVRDFVTDAWPGQAAFYDFALEAGRPLDRNEAATGEILRSRFANTRLDLVIAVGLPAASFYGKYRDALFPSTPLLMLAMDERVAPVEYLKPGDAIVGIKLSPTRILDDILALLPDTTTVAVVFGDSPAERAWVDKLHKEFAAFENRVRFLWLNDLSLPELSGRVATLRPGTVVLYGLFLADVAGIPYEGGYPMTQLHAAANVPMFSFLSAELGRGAVGGALISSAQEGIAASEVASNILSGEASHDVMKVFLEPAAPAFDWRELRRWNIDENRLPPGSRVLFRPSSLWDQHGSTILAGACLLLMQAVLIAALVVQLNHRREAERELQGLGRRLLTAQEDERRRLARELHDDISQRLASVAIDAAWLESRKSRTHDRPQRSVHGELVRLSEDVHALSYRLHPSILEDLGLAEALIAECEQVSRHHSFHVEVDVHEVPEVLPEDVALCVFRVAQEALHNIARHAKATIATLTLAPKAGGLSLAISDNGIGFDADMERRRPSLGRASMDERVRLLGGRLGIKSASGQGTTLSAWVPMAGAFMMGRPRVLLADDHRMVAEGVQRLLEKEFELVAVVEDGRGAGGGCAAPASRCHRCRHHHAAPSGIEALVQLKRDNTDVRVVFLTMHKDAVYARRALEAGASGYVLKHSAQAELFLAVRAALDGKTFISPMIAGEVFRDLKASPTRPSDPVDLLTHRQREILQLFAEGCSTKAMASRLDISTRTVEYHKYQMMDSLKLQSSAELLLFCNQERNRRGLARHIIRSPAPRAIPCRSHRAAV